MEAIAEESNTPIATAYRLFGSKQAILSAVLDVAVGGDDEPIAFGDRPVVRAALAQADAGTLIDAFARIAGELQERAGAIRHLLGGAAAVDPDAAEQLAITRQQRLTGQSRVAAELARCHALAPGHSEADAADLIYVFMSPEIYRILTRRTRMGLETLRDMAGHDAPPGVAAGSEVMVLAADVVVLAVDHGFLLDQIGVVHLTDASANFRGHCVRLGLGFGERVDVDGLFGPVGLGDVNRRGVRAGDGHGAP
jgi:AcrR family transcriptional regulator